MTMKSFVGAEICELIGLYTRIDRFPVLLRKRNVGLYRHEGLAVVKSANGPK